MNSSHLTLLRRIPPGACLEMIHFRPFASHWVTNVKFAPFLYLPVAGRKVRVKMSGTNGDAIVGDHHISTFLVSGKETQYHLALKLA